MELKKVNLLDAMGDEAKERADACMDAIIANLVDINTKTKKDRKLTLTFTLRPTDDSRQAVSVTCDAKATLAPLEPASKTLTLGPDAATGELGLAQWVDEVPGQMDTDGHEAPAPNNIMKFAQQG